MNKVLTIFCVLFCCGTAIVSLWAYYRFNEICRDIQCLYSFLFIAFAVVAVVAALCGACFLLLECAQRRRILYFVWLGVTLLSQGVTWLILGTQLYDNWYRFKPW